MQNNAVPAKLDRMAGHRDGLGGKQPSYLPALDGLRAVSILLVVCSHLGLDRVVPGAFGVTLFFFISGYLITRQLLGNLRAAGGLDLAGFYMRRALRLMPAGFAYIVLAGAFYQFAGGRISPTGWLAAFGYGANYYDLWAGYHSSLPGVRHPFNILWSLAVEEHFYLLWPLLLLALYRSRAAVPVVLGICVAVLLWRLYLLHSCFAPGVASGMPAVCGPVNPNPLWRYNRLYLPSDARLDSIAWGALLALIERAPMRAMAWRAAAGAALLVGSFALMGPLGRHGFRPTVQGAALLGLMPWLIWQESPVRRALCTQPALLVGRLSYSLYLWHWGGLGVADYLEPAGGARWLAVAVPLSVALASASYAWIERPMLRLRRRFGSHAPLSLAARPMRMRGTAPDIVPVIEGAPYATPPP